MGSQICRDVRGVEGVIITFLPTDSRDLTGIDGPDYKLGATCAAPGCPRLKDHSHHVVRRSFLNGDFAWVRMPDGSEIGNKVPLCVKHHSDITENKAKIKYEAGIFFWADPDLREQPLAWQPPVTYNGGILERGLVGESRVTPGRVHESHVHARPVCAGCGRTMPKPKDDTPPEEKRERKTWAVAVPADSLEDGADSLDTLLEAAREELSKAGMHYSEDKKAKFFVLSAALGLFVQHYHSILSDT